MWAEKYAAPDVESTVTKALSNQLEQTKLAEVIQSTQADYPVLNDNNDNYDQSIVDEINEIWDGLSLTMAPSKALARAVQLVTSAKGMSPTGAKDDQPSKEQQSNPRARKKAAVKKNADAQKRQPPKMRGRSAKDDDLDQITPSKLSDKKLFSMSEKELKRLRGD